MNVENAKKSGKRRRICPSCQSGAVISIIYGLPGPEAIKEAEEGLIALGGCLVDDENPNWKCKACEHEW
jgi:hypothetical protein